MVLAVSHHVFLPLLFMVGLVGGTVDAIAGGGGLISLPALLALGVPPHFALGTNKLQATIGTFVATTRYYRHGWFSLQAIYKGLIFGFLGAVTGAIAGQVLSSIFLKKAIPLLLLVMLVYTLFSPTLGKEERQPKINEFWFYVVFGFTMGFYDGFFGPGTGSLWIFFLTFFLGYSFIKAAAYAKVFNLKSNLIATVCFAIGHNIDYRIALWMAVGQLLGGSLGASLAIKKGAKLIRPIFISVVSMTILSLFYKNYYKNYVTTVRSAKGALMLLLIILLMVGSALIYNKFTKKWVSSA